MLIDSKIPLVFIFLLILVNYGCAPSPNESMAKEAINNHFESMGYSIEKINISNISRNPISEREYMGPLTYVVNLNSITLKNMSVEKQRGSHEASKTYSGVSVKLFISNTDNNEWKVSKISGIPSN